MRPDQQSFKMRSLVGSILGGTASVVIVNVAPVGAVDLIKFDISGHFLDTNIPPDPVFPNLSGGSFKGSFTYDLEQPNQSIVPDRRSDYSLNSYTIDFLDAEGNFAGTITSKDGYFSHPTDILISPQDINISFYDQMNLLNGQQSGGVQLSLLWYRGSTLQDNSLPDSRSDFGNLVPHGSAFLNLNGAFFAEPVPTGLNCPKKEPRLIGGSCYEVTEAVIGQTPEPTSTLGLLALSALGAGSALLRKQKP